MIAGRHNGRNVLVSGAASGIGAAIAQRYCEEGATVALLDLNPQAVQAQGERLRSRGFKVAWQAADVGDFVQCQHACHLLAEEIGAIDTLINNAGISPKHEGKPAPIWQMAPEEWHQVVAVNLNGAFNLTRLLSPSMVEQRFGRIVSMSSVAGSAYLPLVAAHYSSTKAAIIGFTRHLAGELGAYGITANALAPGRIETPLLKTVASTANEAVIADTPLLRLGQPWEVADAACYLSAPDSAFITGQVLDVAGGWLMR
ncbi:SDR family oxidoreductase [Pseudomonas asiatica]|uniref:2,3-dihydroxy-2,3-dihydro-p-cumate dehydrogenase n=1 Tax=Pseudomonas monteilii TaxID=76759 RepID=A0A2N1IN32_9PSED|nr:MULTISPECIES: SDR family NAD(P)-dependent oxidoreductase [Pseudomonas]PKI19670.1 3-oxoacyl-[acyl-carrier-protein] reductase [Pseudomonas monteilii]RPD93816.1 SDR family oxidoreductase [Pseudomonas monteilii]WDM87321.1 SDR family oxidoreductase [Pseudomonas asiatica]